MAVRLTSPVQGVEGTILFEAVNSDGVPIPGRKATVVGLVHGNEIVGNAVLSRLEKDAETHLISGSLLLVRANLAAFALNKRNTPEGTDLNRQWDAEHQAANRASDPASLNYEQRRALEVAPLLYDRDAILDLHSTSRPAPPFIVFRDDAAHADLATKLGVDFLVTGLHEAAILDGGTCPDVGLMPGERSPRIGFTFESGQHLDPANMERAWEVAQRFLKALGVWDEAPPTPVDFKPRIFEVIERFQQAPAGAEPYRFVGYTGGEPGGGRKSLPRPLASFDTIDADEILLRRGRTQMVRAHSPFTMLLPTPSADPGTDMYYVAQERPTPRVTVRSHEEARHEALGIEQMLALMADDEYARGTTKASFDARQALDLCAEAVTRVVRLPEGHPHRRITVVGRGDWGGDEAERRAGQRYRAAMRTALEAGVPVDRMQLLRGAALGWFDALTARSMSERMAVRRGKSGEDHGMRLFLSTRQPQTIAVLVLGDLEKAMAESDYSNVWVGLMIETTRAEPDAGWVHVRVARAGLFSARPELLQATARLLETLRREHNHIMNQAPFADHPVLKRRIDATGALCPAGDRKSLASLREALYRLQLREWAPLIRRAVEPQELATAEELGLWMARTMALTGIMDPIALYSLLIVPKDGRWQVGLEGLERALVQGALDTSKAPVPATFVGRKLPPLPLLAEEVDADRIERWIGWKRQLRAAQVIPDTRGKDLDLAFDEQSITHRAGGWMQRAREMAAKKPGSVMVVIAGDGLNPGRERPGGASALLGGHQDALLDPNLRYLRIQHAQGTHLAWLKGVLATLERRPATSEPVAFQWEAVHGALLNVMLVCVRDEDVALRPWSLDGWSVEMCSVLISELRGVGVRDYRVGLFTEPIGPARTVNSELLQFGRAHCEGLLSQGGPRIAEAVGPALNAALERMVIDQIAGWVDRTREASFLPQFPSGEEAQARWIAGELSLGDQSLAQALVRTVGSTVDVRDAALAIWNNVVPWTPYTG